MVWANCVKRVSPEVRSQLNDYFAGYDEVEELQSELEELRKLVRLPRPRKRAAAEEADKGDGSLDTDDSE